MLKPLPNKFVSWLHKFSDLELTSLAATINWYQRYRLVNQSKSYTFILQPVNQRHTTCTYSQWSCKTFLAVKRPPGFITSRFLIRTLASFEMKFQLSDGKLYSAFLMHANRLSWIKKRIADDNIIQSLQLILTVSILVHLVQRCVFKEVLPETYPALAWPILDDIKMKRKCINN